jgi:hypothetical protein
MDHVFIENGPLFNLSGPIFHRSGSVDTGYKNLAIIAMKRLTFTKM